MIESKYIKSITAVMVCVCLVTCGFIVYAANAFDTTNIPEYQRRLFGNEVIILDIQVDAGEWQALLGSAMEKEWISGDLIVNGQRFNTVGIRTKGNSSLMQMGNNGRYSLNFKANKYVKGQTFFGLDTFCVNNMMGDATYMKDYISYDIMRYIGVAAPLANYAKVTVNGEDYGFGIALERYDKAFLDRVYSTAAGQLYNVKIGMGRRGDFEDMWQDVENMFPGGRPQGGRDFGNIRPDGDNPGFPGGRPGGQGFDGWMPDGDNPGFPGGRPGGQGFDGWMPDGDNPGFPGGRPGGQGFDGWMPDGDNPGFPGGRPGGQGFDGWMPDGDNPGFPGGRPGGDRGMGAFGGFGGRGGGSLVYTDDNIESYGAIFDNAVFNSVTANEKQRVIKALENLNAGTDLEKYIDVDATLRYFAAHTVVVNLDSYTSNMQQNYYLYERDGRITILPWDYNLSFGGFMSGDASSVVNFPIDTPVNGVSMEDRPLLNMLLEVEEYRARYHEYLGQIVEGYFESGLFEKTVNTLDAKINEYVRNDVSVFFTFEQYKASLPELIKLGNLRAESIRGQLEGSIPSTSGGQSADGSSLIDASEVNMSTLGSMMGGGGMGRGRWIDGVPDMPEGDFRVPEGRPDMPAGEFRQ